MGIATSAITLISVHRRIASSFLSLLISAVALTAGPDDALFSALLRDHVDEGAVNYDAIANDDRLDTYLDQIAATDPAELPGRNARLAFWINAYNAYTLRLVVSVNGITSIREISGLGTKGDPDTNKPWDQPFAAVGDQNYTLNQIENEIIRSRFGDVRIHYALVCAAYACAQLRSEAYSAEKLDDQLDEQGRWFLANRNEFDPRTRTARLSQIIQWYRVDFGADDTAVLETLADHAPLPVVANSLRNEARRWKVSYLDYDWTLNDRK